MMYAELKEELKAYWEKDFHFVEASWYGDSDVEEWEEVEELFEELEEDEYLHLEVKVDEEKKVVELFVESEE